MAIDLGGRSTSGRSMIRGFRPVYIGATSTGVVRNNCFVSFLHGRCFKKEFMFPSKEKLT